MDLERLSAGLDELNSRGVNYIVSYARSVALLRRVPHVWHRTQGLGLFVRSLVGMERGAAKEALAAFLTGKTLAANQIEFVNLIVNHLTEHGVVEAALLYESPFTDLTPRGPDGLFSPSQVDELMTVLATVRERAVAA